MLAEPKLLGIELTTLVLYFIWYSFLGWAMETTYCSICRGHFVERGFLHGPVCPIYGAGMLLIVFFLRPFTAHLPLFYLIATVTMSSWEYFVGWMLETTTHIKYWDYSSKRFNIKGRVCLQISLCWGAVAYIAIYFIHPATESLLVQIPSLTREFIAAVLAALMLTDTGFTIHSLVQTTAFLQKAAAAQAALDTKRQELAALAEKPKQKLDEAKLQAALLELELRQSRMMQSAAHYSARFRRSYTLMTSVRYQDALSFIRSHSDQLKNAYKERIEKLKELKQKV